MDIIIQSPGFKASEALDSFTREKLSKLAHHSQKIIRADVTLTKGPEGTQDNNCCEIRLEVPGNDHFAKKSGNSFEFAIAEAIHAVQHMLEKSHDKQNSHRHPDPVVE